MILEKYHMKNKLFHREIYYEAFFMRFLNSSLEEFKNFISIKKEYPRSPIADL
jgi:hypothetical protein